MSEMLLALYKKSDGQDNKPQRPPEPETFRKEAVEYYGGKKDIAYYDEDYYYDGWVWVYTSSYFWCHVLGVWTSDDEIKAANLVPLFHDNEEIAKVLFGSKTPSLKRAGNSLLMNERVEKWYASYGIVIVPVNSTELPIKLGTGRFSLRNVSSIPFRPLPL